MRPACPPAPLSHPIHRMTLHHRARHRSTPTRISASIRFDNHLCLAHHLSGFLNGPTASLSSVGNWLALSAAGRICLKNDAARARTNEGCR